MRIRKNYKSAEHKIATTKLGAVTGNCTHAKVKPPFLTPYLTSFTKLSSERKLGKQAQSLIFIISGLGALDVMAAIELAMTQSSQNIVQR